MSTIEEVRVAEKKLQEVLDALRKTDAQDPKDLATELRKVTDDYARAVRELSLPPQGLPTVDKSLAG